PFGLQELAAGVDHVVTRERHGGLAMGKLELEDDLMPSTEADLRNEFEHAAETIVIKRRDGVTVRSEAASPVAQGFRIMQAQYLEIRSQQPGPLDRRHHLAERRDVAARKDVFSDPGIGVSRGGGLADEVQAAPPRRG